MSPDVFFIVGSPRSGTTLLQGVCMSAEGVYVPPETHFLTRFPQTRPLRSPADWELALREIEEVSAREELPLEGLRALAQSAPRTQAGLLRLWLEASARSQGARWVGEASNVHTRDILTLARLFPEAKIVHMIRDPRDVAASQREAWGTSSTRAALRWRDELRVHERARSALNPTRYRAIFYERLVSAPEAEIRALCAWFGWAFQPSMTTPHLRSASGFAARETHKLRSLKPITASRVGRWRQALSSEEVARVELICGPMMTRLGYERAATSLFERLRATPSLVSEAREVALGYVSRRAQASKGALERALRIAEGRAYTDAAEELEIREPREPSL